MVKQAKQLLYLLIPHPACPFFFGWDVSLFLCLKVGVSIQFPPPPYPSFSHSTAVFSFWAVYLHTHTHSHSHTLVPSHSPPRRFLRLCLPPSDTGTDNICSNPLSSSYFFFFVLLLSCISPIVNSLCALMPLCFIQDSLHFSSVQKGRLNFAFPWEDMV